MNAYIDNQIPKVELECFDELDFATAVFRDLRSFGPDHSVVTYLSNAERMIHEGTKQFPVRLAGREAVRAYDYMTETYLSHPEWGRLADELGHVVGRNIFGELKEEFAFLQAA
ncbi:hypothetical protein KDA00_03120 [Candidatus Saccharibacteria bacterium]|nr:hypothetical protein [Candidatus Saccharibacteria bacterium]